MSYSMITKKVKKFFGKYVKYWDIYDLNYQKHVSILDKFLNGLKSSSGITCKVLNSGKMGNKYVFNAWWHELNLI